MTSTALLYHFENVRDMYGIIISVFFFFVTLKFRSQELEKSISKLDLERNRSYQIPEVTTDQCKSAEISMSIVSLTTRYHWRRNVDGRSRKCTINQTQTMSLLNPLIAELMELDIRPLICDREVRTNSRYEEISFHYDGFWDDRYVWSSILVVRKGDSGFVRSRTTQRNDTAVQKRLILLRKTHQSMITEEDSVYYQYLRTYGYECSFD